jgi:hypothetical protein
LVQYAEVCSKQLLFDARGVNPLKQQASQGQPSYQKKQQQQPPVGGDSGNAWTGEQRHDTAAQFNQACSSCTHAASQYCIACCPTTVATIN